MNKSPGISKQQCFYAAVLLFFNSYSQITQINTGSNAALSELSIIGNTIVMNGSNDYIVESTNECKTLTPLPFPAPLGSPSRLQRPDLANMFLLSFNPSQTLVYHSADGGHNWNLKSNTSGAYSHEWAFFNATEGLMTDGLDVRRTIDAGATWTNITLPSQISTTAIKTFGDSMVIVGGAAFPNAGGEFVLSKDRGHSWPYSYVLSSTMTNFFFLNKDTIFGISMRKNFGSNYTRTTDGGSNWQNSYIPIDQPLNIYFKNVNEGYVVGNDPQGNGIILKTTDFGKSWATFNTQIKTMLLNIAPLNDSTMLLTGTNGVILKWDYRNAIFTGLTQEQVNHSFINIFPNPVKDKLSVEFNGVSSEKIKLTFYNLLGQEVYSARIQNSAEPIEISALIPGIYNLQMEGSESGIKRSCKLIKQ